MRLPDGPLSDGPLSGGPLSGIWEDRTVTMLRPIGADGGASIVVTRDTLPANMSLDEHVARQRLLFQQELPGFTLLQDTPGELDAHPSHLLEFHWNNRGTSFFQAVVIVLRERRLLNFTASVPRDAADVETREALLRSICSFRFAPPEGPVEVRPT
ncbi:hypothetical protein GCM10011611_59010 [Aliidongia dinghuensis]|uniref:DUF1795 domain-containing protein n=1 Tax=Aliidongia dinghuensis TaxID=1867774 RepID=A0A8J2Z103_9PROT|nr:hypothetical protein GCM10011611_59010 [Aliidongia dinghuensis]